MRFLLLIAAALAAPAAALAAPADMRPNILYCLGDDWGWPFAGAYGALGSLGGAAVTQKRLPNTQNLMLRGTLVIEPNDAFKARIKVSHANQKAEGPGFDAQMGSCPDGTAPANAAAVRFLATTDDCRLNRRNHIINVDPAAFPARTETVQQVLDLARRQT